MDDLKVLEELVSAYDDLVNITEARQYSQPVIDSVKDRRAQLTIELQGARGAKGLNPLTGEAS